MGDEIMHLNPEGHKDKKGVSQIVRKVIEAPFPSTPL